MEEGFVEVAVDAAREAGRVQKDHLGRTNHVEFKGEINPVTEVDRFCEETIIKRIRDAFPDHDLLTEESPFKGTGSRFKWIIDPLDGTTNYIHGYPCFGVSIGLEVGGVMELGVVYDPTLGELFQAERGKGAFLNGDRIHVSQTDVLNRSLICVGFPYDVREHPDFYLRYFRQFLIKSLAVRRPGSAVLDLCHLAAGRFDGFWEVKLHPWDVAAASLIAAEAGGKLTGLEGKTFNIYSGEIVASNGRIHREMLQAIQEVKAERIG
jgi:myo-inositol-1(or 4)-monophosphatase